ncbi:MAG: radical SAM protein [Methanosarcinaceae archaeon]|nr:radical SAM protein [Methanosarcinaceae archaeon]
MNNVSPTIVTFSITRQCNLNCKHCYSRASSFPSPDELSTNEAVRVLDEIKAAGTMMIIFDGGEPTLRSDLLQLISHAAEIGLIPILGTNGTTMTLEMAVELKKAGLKICAVSLDGATAKTHDDFRNVPGSFEDALRGIEYLKEAGIPFQVNPCVHSLNYHEIPDLLSFAQELGAVGVEIFEFIATGRGRSDSTLGVDKKLQVVEQILEYSKTTNMTTRMIGIPQFDILYRQNNDSSYRQGCCGAGRSIACIFNDGTVYPCMLMQMPVGNVRENSFVDIWNDSIILNKLRNRENLKGKCGRCFRRDECGGARCKAYINGDFLSEDPDCQYLM